MMPNSSQDVNRSQVSSPTGAVLGVELALSDKVLMGLFSLLLTFLSGVAYGHTYLSKPHTQDAVSPSSQDFQDVPSQVVERENSIPQENFQ
ncbi:hypothetical protein [Sphaerothrix gracilis]|uniref:hypothetical protein n=1 Tax=Sphaerothrix gracilis TaxID=3151835 RepID=UPI0031FBCE70